MHGDVRDQNRGVETGGGKHEIGVTGGTTRSFRGAFEVGLSKRQSDSLLRGICWDISICFGL